MNNIRDCCYGGEATSDDLFVVWRNGESDRGNGSWVHYSVKLPFERINYMLEKQDEMIESLTKQVSELTHQVQLLKEQKNAY